MPYSDPFAADPDRLECHPSKVRMIGLLAGAFCLVAASYFCTRLPSWRAALVGWLGIAFFGVALVLIPFRFFTQGAQVIIDNKGIDDRRLGFGLIPWGDVRQVVVISIKGTEFLSVDLVDPAAYLARMSGVSKVLAKSSEALGLSILNIGFVGLEPGINVVKEFLRDHGRL